MAMGYDEQEYTKSFDWRSWKKLIPFLKPYRKLIFVVLALNVVCACIDIALPLFQRYAIDEFIETGDASGLPGFCRAECVRDRRADAGGNPVCAALHAH